MSHWVQCGFNYSDDGTRDGGSIRPEVEIKRRKMEVEDKQEEASAVEIASKRLVATSDRETMTIETSVMQRCVTN